MTDVLYFSSSFPGFSSNVHNDARILATKRLYSINRRSLLTFDYDWNPPSGAAAQPGGGETFCIEFVTSSFYENNYDIVSTQTSLYQYDNNADMCLRQNPFIVGVRGARTLRTNNIPYSLVKTNQNINMNSGTFYPQGLIP